MAKQPILKELEYFVNGATAASTINPSGLSHLVHCGLNLLHNLPASKDAVFEYFTIFFDASVAGYVKLMEVSGDVDGDGDDDAVDDKHKYYSSIRRFVYSHDIRDLKSFYVV